MKSITFYRVMMCCCFIFASVTAQAAESSWQLKKAENGITVTQQATDSGYPITRGSVEIAASVDAIITLMRDHAACYRWFYACKQSRLIQQYDARTRLDYAVLKSPYFFADRDMYIYTDLSYDRATQTVLIRVSGRQTHDKGQPSRVRIKDLQGFWRIQKLVNNKTAVLYQVYNNPQIAPSGYLNNYLVWSVFQTLKNLAAISTEAKYRNAQLEVLN